MDTTKNGDNMCPVQSVSRPAAEPVFLSWAHFCVRQKGPRHRLNDGVLGAAQRANELKYFQLQCIRRCVWQRT